MMFVDPFSESKAHTISLQSVTITKTICYFLHTNQRKKPNMQILHILRKIQIFCTVRVIDVEVVLQKINTYSNLQTEDVIPSAPEYVQW